MGSISPTLLAVVRFCWDEMGQNQVKVLMTPMGQKTPWLRKLDPTLKLVVVPILREAMKFPETDDQCLDLAEIGVFEKGPDKFIALRAESQGLAIILMKVISRLCPITGGGVSGTYGYRGTGWSKASPIEWTYHWSSFGIGD